VKSSSWKRIAAAGGFALLLALAGVLWLRQSNLVGPPPQNIDIEMARRESSRLAFDISYLDAANGHFIGRRRECSSCHTRTEIVAPQRFGFLNERAALTQEAWASEILLPTKCGGCHRVPDPTNLPRQSWREVMSRMTQIAETRGAPRLTDDEFHDVLHFYFTFSAEVHARLPEDPDPRASPLRFEPMPLGNPPATDPRDRPFLGHVQMADSNSDGRLDVLVCDTGKSAFTRIQNDNGVWKEEPLAMLRNPARAVLLSGKRNAVPDIVVACLGAAVPTDDPVGSVALLSSAAGTQFANVTILGQIGRVAAVEPGDFDGDGDWDFVVAAFGFVNQGEVGWLEKRSGTTYAYHQVCKKSGAVNVLPAELNGDGHLDFVALFAQEHEEVSAFLNEGGGRFQERLLFKAATPAFGLSGIRLADLDQDGDLDILCTNGDNLDLPTILPRPFHGVQWLENRGNLSFVWRDIYRCYGAYCAVAGDLNKDGHLDIVFSTLFNDWSDPKRASLLWLENNGQQQFTPHTISTQPTHLISADIGDLDGDGWLDVVACGMHSFPPFDRMGRITLWKNHGRLARGFSPQ